ncbi:MAG: hypothetical protein M3Q69_15395 [Acidobacteriota bacterium]|nr:hypothetical protein [Acidobacteriota bacterium]
MTRRRWPAVYALWLALCAGLFVAFGGQEDPSRPVGRILSIDAGERARAIVASRGMRDYEVVHVARARRGEGANEDRWIVLLDRVPHTSLQRAVVVELDVASGNLLRIRAPER